MNKRIHLIILFMGATLLLQAQEGLEFISEDWNQALEKARAENKYIVLDCYTDWCGWCKVMEKKTFSDPNVAEYYNANFIPVRIDMEKGIGIDLAMKYRISAFPSILYFTPEGRLVYRTVGYREIEAFMTDGHDALNREKQFNHPGDPLNLDPEFPEFYKNSFRKGKEREWPEQQIVTDFLEIQEDLFSEKSWAVMSRFSLGKVQEEFFLENMARYRKYYGDVEVDRKFGNLVYEYVRLSVKEKNVSHLDDGIGILKRYGNPEDTASQASAYRVHYYKQVSDWENYARLAIRAVETLDPQAGTLNDYAWTFYENVEDRDALNRAVEWMGSLISKHPEYSYIDTYAALLFKVGRVQEAEEFALEAIKIGTEEKAKVDSTRELLEKIRKAEKK